MQDLQQSALVKKFDKYYNNKQMTKFQLKILLESKHAVNHCMSFLLCYYERTFGFLSYFNFHALLFSF